MTFTVTPQPNNVPPRVRIDINTDNPSKPFTSLVIKRDGKILREQPFIGSSAAVVYDYEAPFGRTATYTAAGTTAITSVVRNESWADLAGWSVLSGSPTVSGGRLRGGEVGRSPSYPPSGRLESQGLTVGAGGVATLRFGAVVIENYADQPSRFSFAGSSPILGVGGLSSAFSITWSSSGATLTTGAGSWVIGTAATGSYGFLRANAVGLNSFVEPFVVYSVANDSFSAIADVYLDVQDAWLIHPSKPSLSIPIEMGATGTGPRFIEASSGESKTSQAVSTIHRPVGRARAVVITSGPRQADEWTLVVGAETIAAKNDVRAIVDDQTPLLFRSPLDMGLDLPDDWYSVGDFTVARVEVPAITQWTTMTLPLTPVDEPIVRVGALWTWGDVLTRYATWADVLADNATWLDVLAGPSS